MSANGVVVDGDALYLPAQWEGPLDIAFDGRRIFSVEPGRHRQRPDGLRRVAWPVQLRAFLTGRTELVVAARDPDAELASLEVDFGGGSARVAVVDDEGAPLTADKFGRLTHTFDTVGENYRRALLDRLDELLRDITDILDVPSFIAYGTLLGAVRDGDFIGHDTDADVAYLSAARGPVGIVAESLRLRRGLTVRGWRLHPSTTTALQVWRPEDSHDFLRIDVFTAHVIEGSLTLDLWVRGGVTVEDITPLGSVLLADRRLPAPARPEALLEATYGPKWRVPDPAFRYPSTRTTTGRSGALFGHMFNFDVLRQPAALEPPGRHDDLRPSGFGRWVAAQWPADARVVDLRQGVGHDPIWWAHGLARGSVLSLDVRHRSRYRSVDRDDVADRLRLERLPIQDLRRTMICAAQAARPGTGTLVLTLPGTLDDMRAAARANLRVFVRMLREAGAAVYAQSATAQHIDELARWLADFGAVDVSDEDDVFRLHTRNG